MQIEEYMMHYEQFLTEFEPDTTPEKRAAKAVEEMCEYLEAPSDDEAVDLMNASISLVISRGIKNPLFAGYLKLQRTAEKYRGEK